MGGINFSLEEIIILIAPISILNVYLSFSIYKKHRDNPIYKYQFLFWIATLLTIFMNGIADGRGEFIISLPVVLAYLTNVLQFQIMSQLYKLDFKPLPWVKFYAVTQFLTIIGFVLNASFTIMVFPVCFMAAFPTLYFFTKYKSIKNKSSFDYLLIFSFLFSGIHMLDYPFLRLNAAFAPLGFYIYFSLLFIKSIALPYLVLNFAEKNQQAALEHEIGKKTDELNEANLIINYNSKMIALGEMAGGIAHEINNPLAIINAHCAYLLKLNKKGKLNEKIILEEIEQINKTSIRISKIVQSMRIISGDNSKNIKRESSVSSIIENVYTLIEEACRIKNINLALNLPENLKNEVVFCNSVQLSQVLMNLLNNSVDAITNPDRQQSNKWIELKVCQVGEHMEFRVTDSGEKIPPEVALKIFQPFYTTKEIGKGTGLGLSLSAKLIQNHGGKLLLDEEAETPSFYFHIPIAAIS